jgi:hypothetical protein
MRNCLSEGAVAKKALPPPDLSPAELASVSLQLKNLEIIPPTAPEISQLETVPTELRLMIWSYPIPLRIVSNHSRVIWEEWEGERGGEHELCVYARLRRSLPAILQVNQESRYCALEQYSPYFKPQLVRSRLFQSPNPIKRTAEPIQQDFQHFFKRERDYLLLDVRNPRSPIYHFETWAALDFMARVKYLVLGFETFTYIVEDIKEQNHMFKIEAFSGLREIIVVGISYTASHRPDYVLRTKRRTQHLLGIYPKEKVPKFRFVENKNTLAEELMK